MRCFAILGLVVCSAAAWADNRSVFEKRLGPVLQRNCGGCHGGTTPQGGFSVASIDGLLRGGKHGAAIVPGAAAQSLLVAYVKGEQSPKMPLGGAISAEALSEIESAINAMEKISDAKAETKRDAHLEWLLTKPKLPEVPKVSRTDWVKNPIDAFVLAKLEAKGISPAPEASRRTLIRRVYFDLLGVPPSPEEVKRFETDPDADAWKNLIGKLLDDPRYGERWARHWLDLVRYGESDGFAIDSEKPTVWRYRDYVIRAFNRDKPYDLFVKEQLAGDELADKRANEKDRPERLVAMGFYRLGTWEADANSKKQLRQDFLNDVTGTTSATFLGLTVGCAQCHNHKYDPIPQKDYYRMQAFFAAMGIEELPAPFLEAENPKEARRLARYYEDALEAAEESMARNKEALRLKYIELKKIKPDDPKIAAFLRELGVKNAFFQEREEVIVNSQEFKEFRKAKDDQQRLGELVRRYRPVAYTVKDVAPPNVPELPATHVLASGDLAAKGELVEPGFPTCITGKSEPAKIPFQGGSSGRRLALAEWIASAENPFTARVMVNRIWQHHFGEGIVRTPSDFGRNGAKPSHPELLDWLAVSFVEKGWSMKAMHRLMLESNAYRMASRHPEQKKYAETDANNELLWRMNWTRLDSESLRDSVLALSGRLNPARGGPGALLEAPQDVVDGFEFFKWYPSPEAEQLRRSIYTFQRRSFVNPMMEVFDTASIAAPCPRRNVTNVPPQALTLMNGELTSAEAKHFAARVTEEAGADVSKQIDRAFWLALSRAPGEKEAAESRKLFARYPQRRALEHLAAVLFNTNEFLYLD